MKTFTRSIGGAALALAAATALALSVAVPANAVASVTGSRTCGGAYTPKFTIKSIGNTYVGQKQIGGVYNGWLYYNTSYAVTRSYTGKWQAIEYKAGQNVGAGDIISHSSTCIL